MNREANIPGDLQLTGEQRAALTTRGTSIGLTAGAGCGKTFVLTHRYLSCLEPDATSASRNSLQKTVAITFTDRAAREMRDRIRSACQDRIAGANNSTDIEYWQRILRGLDLARISTIHAFCTGILRSHAAELGLDPNFRMMEGTEFTTMLSSSVEQILHRRLADRDEIAMRVVGRFELERTTTTLQELLKQRFRLKPDQFDDRSPEDWVACWTRLYEEEFIPASLTDLAESYHVQKLKSLFTAYQPDKPNHQQACRIVVDAIDQLSQMSTDSQLLDDWQQLLSNLSENIVIKKVGAKSEWDNDDIYIEIMETMKKVREGLNKRKKEDYDIPKEEFEAAVAWSRDFWDLLKPCWSAYDENKRRAGVLDFDDLLVSTRNLLADNPAAQKRLAKGIDFLLIDEFQDTDPIQTEIVRLLCEHDIQGEKLFLVGDVKQSIYRFRRADPEVFLQLRSEIPEPGQLPLLTNFRSRGEIIYFVNGLFDGEFSTPEAPLVPHRNPDTSLPPRIEFLFPQILDIEKPSTNQLRRTEAEWIAARIRQLLQDETAFVPDKTHPDGHRRVTSGDIVILFRAMGDVPIYEDALRRLGIDYYLVGGRTFYAQQEVFDLINLCRTIAEPDDPVSLIGLLRSPFFSMNDESIYLLGREERPITEVLFDNGVHLPDPQQLRQARYAARVISELRMVKDDVSLFELLTKAIEQTGYDAALLMEHLGERKLANLRKLLEMAHQFDVSGTRDFSDFISELQDAISDNADEELAATSPEAGNTVRLMSIHQSKGLEFPVVFVADMNRKEKVSDSNNRLHPEMGPLVPMPKVGGESPRHPGIIVDRFFEKKADQEEAIRLLYVAMTRAADLLILSGSLASDMNLQNNWMKLLDKKFDLMTGLPKTDPILGSFSLGSLAAEEIPEIRVHHVRPEFEPSKSKQSRRLKLTDFETIVNQVDPTPPNRMADPIEVDSGPRRVISVSEIEKLTNSDGHQLHFDQTEKGDEDLKIDSAGRFGSLVHGILERIDFTAQEYSTDEMTMYASHAARKLNSKPTEGELDQAVERCQDLLQHSLAGELGQAKRLYRELPFMLQWPESDVSVQGTIDCLFQDDENRWHLIDYKTGSVSANEDSILAVYGFQLATYTLAVSLQTGQLPHTTRLVLIRNPVHVIDIHWTDSRIADYSQKIDNLLRQIPLNPQ